MIRLLTHNGFTEPSRGVQQKGFAVRGSAILKVRVDESQVLEKLNIILCRTSKHWPNAFIKIQLNDLDSYKLHTVDLGQKEITIDLPREMPPGVIKITFSIFPKGIFKFLNTFFFSKRKSLVRDSILLTSLYLDETKIINYHHKNRFAFGNSLQQKEITVRILGFFGQTFGLAEAARRTFNCLINSEFAVTATQIPYSGKHHGKDSSVKSDKGIPRNFDEIRIFHFNGDHLDRVIDDWGESILDCRYKIGVWHWELPEFPDDYLSWFNYLDELWVPSRFVFDAIAPKSPIPVQIIPLAIDNRILNPPPPNREKFNIPEKEVIFLITFDFYSIFERKNPIAGIKAFSKLIENEYYKDKAHLVVKVSNQHADKEGYDILLKTLTALSPQNITIINKVLPRKDMIQLINSCDALISLHRSEGFGLHLAEAMAMGKAVVATNWSGNTEFMNNKNSYPVEYELVELEEDYGPYRKGNYWADPSSCDALEKIKSVVENIFRNNTRINDEVRKTILEQLVEERISKRLKYINHTNAT